MAAYRKVGNLKGPKGDAADIADGSITEAKLEDGAVATMKLADGAVTDPKLADGAVSEAKLRDGAVTESKLAGGSLTPLKLDSPETPDAGTNIVRQKLLGTAIFSPFAADADGVSPAADYGERAVFEDVEVGEGLKLERGGQDTSAVLSAEQQAAVRIESGTADANVSSDPASKEWVRVWARNSNGAQNQLVAASDSIGLYDMYAKNWRWKVGAKATPEQAGAVKQARAVTPLSTSADLDAVISAYNNLYQSLIDAGILADG